MIRVIVTGALGKMGSETVKAIMNTKDIKLISAVDIGGENGSDIGLCLGLDEYKAILTDSIHGVIENADCLVDFTNSTNSPHFIKTALKNGVNCVVGTTGIDKAELDEISDLADKYSKAVLIVPNFSIGAVLMMKFANEAGQYFDNAEIIEMHHDKKQDAPSGTALMTAYNMTRDKVFTEPETKKEILEGVRGATFNGIKIHSVRLPGLVAHQQVMFGGEGEIFTIRHDSMARTSFMPGVLKAIRKIGYLKGLNFGLEQVL